MTYCGNVKEVQLWLPGHLMILQEGERSDSRVPHTRVLSRG